MKRPADIIVVRTYKKTVNSPNFENQFYKGNVPVSIHNKQKPLKGFVFYLSNFFLESKVPKYSIQVNWHKEESCSVPEVQVQEKL